MHQHFSNHDFISFSFWGLRPKDHYQIVYFIHAHPIITVDLSMNVNNWAHPLNHVICFKYLLQICTKMNGFKFDFSKNSGEEQRAPSQNSFPRFRSGFALRSGFTLNSWALRTLYSGFALDYRALRSLDSGFTLNFQLAKLVWPPKYISGSASACPRPFDEFLDRLLIIDYTDWL